MNRMINFKEWLQREKGIANLYTVEGIIWYIESITNFALKFSISQTPVLEINVPKDFIDIIDMIYKDKNFTGKYRPNKIKCSKSIDFYIQYLTFIQFKQLNILNISKQKYEIVECNDRKIPNIEVDVIQQSQEQNFLEFLIDIKRLSEIVAQNYIYVLNNICDFCKVNNISETPILIITTIEEYNRIANTIKLNKHFQNKNKSADYRYGVALNNYREYLIYRKLNDQSYKLNSVTQIEYCTKEDMEVKFNESNLITETAQEEQIVSVNSQNQKHTHSSPYKLNINDASISVDNYYVSKIVPDVGIESQTINIKCDNVIEEVEFYINQKQYTKMQKSYIETLDQYFPKGIRISSSIQVNKFKKLAQQIQVLNCDNEVIVDELQTIAVCCDESLYMSPNKIVEDKILLEEILGFVLDTFKETKKVVFFDGILNHFKDELIYTNIYNSTALKGFLEYYFGDYFYVQKNYISISSDIVIEVQDEIEEIIKKSDSPIKKHDILQLLPHISKKKIIETLKYNKNILYWQTNEYWHIERIYISEQEKNLIRDVIWYETRDGFISVKKLYEILKEKAVAFIESNCIINYICLRDILKCYFVGEFGFKYSFIGKVGEEMSVAIAMQNFTEGKEMFKLIELSNFVEENDLQGTNSLFIEEVGKLYIRIDEDNFLLKEKLNPSIDMIKYIEATVKKYLTNGYVTLSSIDSFTIFPTFELKWNIFLLQSIIEGYCNNLKIYSFSRNGLKPIGVIADNSFGYHNYGEILVKEIVTQDLMLHFADEEVAIEYLFNNGYLAQRRMKNFDRLFMLAKFKNKQGNNNI